jgi:ribosomal protein S1
MEDFASLLEESYKKRKSIEPGSLHQAKVTRKTKDFVFIETISEKIKGIVSAAEFAEVAHLSEKGSEVNVHFLEEQSGDYLFTFCLQGEDITSERLNLSMERDLPILGQIVHAVNGGYEVKLGDFLGFCPMNQFESNHKGEDLAGRRFKFVVTDLDKKRIVVSQRKIADREREEVVSILKSQWKVGSFVTATIQSIQKSGMQATIEGLSSFIPMSEASYSKSPNLDKEFKLGQNVKAKIIDLDWSSNRIILSIKDFLKDPWTSSLPFREGEIVSATVESVKPFGIFVKITDEFHGLVPNRETGFSQKVNLSNEFKHGQIVRVLVLEINPEKRQVAVSIARAKETEDRMEYQEYLTSEKESHSTSSFGMLLKKSLSQKQK